MPSSIPPPPPPLLLTVANRQRTRKVNLRLLRKIVAGLVAELNVENAELGIHLVAGAEMISLNETFLRHAGPTDVITFDYAGPEEGARAGGLRATKNETRGRAAGVPLHGEIFICVDEAIQQAKRFKTTWQAEIVRYVVHGVLHLRGHDDSRPAARRRMKREENRRLRGLARRFSLAQLARTTKLAA